VAATDPVAENRIKKDDKTVSKDDSGVGRPGKGPAEPDGFRHVGKKRQRHLRRLKRRKRKPVPKKTTGSVKNTALAGELKPPDMRRLSGVRYGVFDIETQRSAREVGGWHRADQMRVSCVVLYDSKDNVFHEYREGRVEEMIDHLRNLDLVIGFNIKKFDYRVLSGYSDFNFHTLPTLDLLENVYIRLGYRLSLNHLAKETLGILKSADGLQALRWWKQGRIREIVAYCKKDVEITRDLYLFGREHRYLVFKNKAGQAVRVPVSW
jgi:DEAD/DEAH box helicase domain-containing protein